MEKMRKPFQGVSNIVLFNWHFYVIAFSIIIISVFAASYFDNSLKRFIYCVCILVAGSTITSLLVSFYVYDYSGIYTIKWIDQRHTESLIVNINAGFDETSTPLNNKFANAKLVTLDFYNAEKHTEVSIKRARKAYPPFPGTQQIETSYFQTPDNSADKIFVIFSAHEIRNESERIAFFKELKRVIKPDGEIYITEHLRDIPNFLAYNIGFLHFYTKGSWYKVFESAELEIVREIKLTLFISTFILSKNGNTH
jgi:ubiquinone/menaquinone biosynthesis C-methylase UbiE